MFRVMFKIHTLIITGIILWCSVECGIWSIKSLVNDCFQYECVSNDTKNGTANEEKVCGLNGILYENMEALECANRCAGLFNHVITKKPLGFCSENPTALDFY
ncbi:hypothetical protein WA026_023043 [Henosepilachna vigintioctopunctata]|uniref:Uncharacterized protein n=1 Tax=Henosepilachna vigintioctopunctata TaxID=420089 RepID=A0AAW1VHQ0_9CUCU